MTMFIAMTVWFLGFAVGFVAYQGARVGVQEWKKVLEEESTKKEPLAYTGKVD